MHAQGEHCALCLFLGHPSRYLAGERQRQTEWLVQIEDLKLLAPSLSAIRSLDATASALLLALAVAKDLRGAGGSARRRHCQYRPASEKAWRPLARISVFVRPVDTKELRASEWKVAERPMEFGPGEHLPIESLPSEMTDSMQRVVQFCRKLDVTLCEIALPPYEFAVGDLDCVTSLGPLRAMPDREYAPSANPDGSPGRQVWELGPNSVSRARSS